MNKTKNIFMWTDRLENEYKTCLDAVEKAESEAEKETAQNELKDATDRLIIAQSEVLGKAYDKLGYSSTIDDIVRFTDLDERYARKNILPHVDFIEVPTFAKFHLSGIDLTETMIRFLKFKRLLINTESLNSFFNERLFSIIAIDDEGDEEVGDDVDQVRREKTSDKYLNYLKCSDDFFKALAGTPSRFEEPEDYVQLYTFDSIRAATSSFKMKEFVRKCQQKEIEDATRIFKLKYKRAYVARTTEVYQYLERFKIKRYELISDELKKPTVLYEFAFFPDEVIAPSKY